MHLLDPCPPKGGVAEARRGARLCGGDPTSGLPAPLSLQRAQDVAGESLRLIGEDEQVDGEIAAQEAVVGGEIALERGPSILCNEGLGEGIAPIEIGDRRGRPPRRRVRSEEHTSELQSLMRTSYAVFCLKK